MIMPPQLHCGLRHGAHHTLVIHKDCPMSEHEYCCSSIQNPANSRGRRKSGEKVTGIPISGERLVRASGSDVAWAERSHAEALATWGDC